jgi:peptide-methionine (S)-S-oxide reductase
MPRIDMKIALLITGLLLGALAFPRVAAAETRVATVAGGCFWCVEADFEKVRGVKEVVSGYTGGTLKDPTYKDVTKGGTGHYEAVQIYYDPAKITYDQILYTFLRSVDVTDAGGQFCDRGDSYRTAIFVSDANERASAEAAIAQARSDLGARVVTPILELGTFYEAEDYHQNYYKGRKIVLTRAGPKRQDKAYEFYRDGCGRDDRVRALWGSAAVFAGG